jgi:hypothetical protein
MGKSNSPSFKRLHVMEDRSYASACAGGQNPAAPWRWFTLRQMPSFGRADILCTTRHFQFKAVAFSSRFRMHFSRVSSRHSDLRGVRGRPWFDLVGRCFCPDSFLVACSNFLCQAGRVERDARRRMHARHSMCQVYQEVPDPM